MVLVRGDKKLLTSKEYKSWLDTIKVGEMYLIKNEYDLMEMRFHTCVFIIDEITYEMTRFFYKSKIASGRRCIIDENDKVKFIKDGKIWVNDFLNTDAFVGEYEYLEG